LKGHPTFQTFLLILASLFNEDLPTALPIHRVRHILTTAKRAPSSGAFRQRCRLLYSK